MSGILVIEDEPIIRRNLVLALRRAGHAVSAVATAWEAALALSTKAFRLVFADISLGDGDGLRLIASHAGRLTGVPVVVMTGRDTVAHRLRAEGLSVAAFLAKPFALSRAVEIAGALLSEGSAAPERGPRVLMYSHDTIGLGHMRRNSAIAKGLVAQVPGLSVLMLVGCPGGPAIPSEPGIDQVKLPSLAKLGRGRWQSGSLRVDAETMRAMRAGLIGQAVETFRPDLVLVDHEPAGVWHELVAPLRALRAQGTARIVLGLRDILDEPGRVRAAWAVDGLDRLVPELYDEILVYGDEAFFPSRAAYGLDALMPGRARSMGIVTHSRPSGRPRSGPPRRILVSGGGGRDAGLLLDTALAALESIPAANRPEATLIAGPLMDPELGEALAARAAALGATFHDSVPDLPERMEATDLLVAMAGYNSAAEALAIGCPLLVVPRVGPSAEQRLRAERLAALGLARTIAPWELDPARLAQALLDPVPARPGPLPALDGAARVARHLARLLAHPVPSTRSEVALHA